MKFFKTISIKNMDIEDSIPALASAIISVYDIQNIVNNELRDLKHVEYGIMKELFGICITKKIVSAIIELKSGINKTHIFKKT
jgi:hypothetical protein